MPSKPTCSVYVHAESIYVFSETRSDYGSFLASPPAVLKKDITSQEIGESILRELAASRDVGSEIDLKRSTEAYKANLKPLGFRSFKSFANEARFFSVQCDNTRLLIEEWTSNGKDAFLGSGKAPAILESNAQVLGDYLKAQFTAESKAHTIHGD